ncbi:MAG: hypothetical protein GXO58_01340 [Thermodesulfobacteria bacterium]|nr:hypothetical protein [Thermodesulfobacteriota bacterium]
MKRWFFGILLFLFLVGGLFVPHWITSSVKARDAIVDLLKKELHATTSYSDLNWYWLPTPHLAFSNLSIKSEEFSLDASYASVYPDWISVISGKPAIGGISLEDVHLIILKITKKEEKETTLPRWIRVRNGFVEISKKVTLPLFPFKDRRPYVKNLYGSLEIEGDVVAAKLQGNTRQAKRVALEGHVNLKDLGYEFKGTVEQLDLTALKVKDVTTKKQFPSYGFLNFHLEAQGKGLEWSRGKVKAYSNCFVTKGGASKAIFSCGSLDMAYEYKHGTGHVELKELTFQRPKFFVKGEIKLYKKDNGYRIWAELSGKDFDLAQIRQALLALSIKDKDVTDYCRAVRAGMVTQATLHMDAPAVKWHSLSDMEIRGRAKGVKLYVKDEDFFVDSATGSFEILDGVLYARDVVASLRSSKGTAGSLVLGLSKGREQFKLDIQVVSPAQDVKWALLKFSHNDLVHEELSRLAKLKGVLSGRLRIGDRKHDKHVKIDVKSVKLAGFYETVGMPVAIHGARASYFQDELSINDLSGSLGPNSIKGLSGVVSWKGHDLRVKISRARGHIKTESVLELCNRFNFHTDFIKEMRLAMSGYVKVRRANLDFRASDPASVRFLFTLNPEAVHVQSRLVPMPVMLGAGQLTVSTDQVAARQLNLRLGRNKARLWADLHHRGFRHWKGWIKADTLVNRGLWKWFRAKGLHLDEFEPRLPFEARAFKVTVDNGHITAFQGGLRWMSSGVQVELAGKNGPGFLELSKIDITRGERSCRIGFARSTQRRKKRLSFSFRGELEGEVLDKILKKNTLLFGDAKGDFDFGFELAQGAPNLVVQGVLDAKKLKWIWSKDVDLFFDTLHLEAVDGKGRIDSSFKVFDDEMTLQGRFETHPHRLQGRLKLVCPVLSPRVFSMIQESAESQAKKSKAGRGHSGKASSNSNELVEAMLKALDVNLAFDIGEARYAVTDFAKSKTGKPHVIVLRNLRGQAQLDGNVLEEMDVYSDDTCGLDVYLRKERVDGSFMTEFSAITPPKKTARFEEVLDCLGIKQDLITGRLSLDLYLRGANRVLLGNGRLKIEARDGYIHKFGLLSKIFSVVNVVDIFSLNKGLLEGSSPYKKMLVDAKIKSGRVHLEKAYIKGSGINFYGTGDVFLDKKTLDLIIFIQPLKTVDTIITSLPIIGGIIGGKNKSLFAIPVKLSGNWRDPKVDTLQTKAVTDLFKKLIFNVLTAPFNMVH